MLLTGITGKGFSTLQGKSPSRSLHWLPLILPPLSLAASWVGSSSSGGKAPGQDYNPLKEGGAQETLHGQLVRSLPQALHQQGEALHPTRRALCRVDGSARETPATTVLQQPSNGEAQAGAARLTGCEA